MVLTDFGFYVDDRYAKQTKIEQVENQNDISIYKISISFLSETEIENCKICWYKPMRGVLSVWHPTAGRNRATRQWFDKNTTYSNFYLGAPLISAINGNDNYSTVAFSDCDTPISISFFVDDFADKDQVCFEATLFNGVKFDIKNYEVFVRIDNSNRPYYKCISSVNDWWKRFYNRELFNCESAEAPLYSSWYNYHQHPNSESLKKELVIAKELGFKTIILDDGWQYDGLGTADYYDCGDWAFSKEKFPNPKEFVKTVHSLGMKILVWFPVPFVGYNTNKYVAFKDMLLCDNDFFRAGILDPRFKAVRDFLVNTYREFVLEYDLDGLKLDFIDSFKLLSTSKKFDSNIMDVEKVEDGVNLLLEDVIAMLKEVRKEPLFEFRQYYVGASITRFCNMLRVADCAFDSITNKIAIADLRLLNYDLAVHSDMLYWSKKETNLNVKRQLNNVLFSVPQISILLNESPSEHIKIIKGHLDYYNKNREILLHGEMQALNPEMNYSVVASCLNDKKICVCYDRYCFDYVSGELHLINNGSLEDFIVCAENDCEGNVFDIFNNAINTFKLSKGLNKILIPKGGRIEIK